MSKLMEAIQGRSKENPEKKKPGRPRKEETDTLQEVKNDGLEEGQRKGSINPNYILKKKEENFVHYMLVDWSEPRNKGGRHNVEGWRPTPRLVKTTTHDFVKAYNASLEGSKLFKGVNSPGKLARIIYSCKDNKVASEVIKKAFHGRLRKLTDSGAQPREAAERLRAKFLTKLSLRGANIFVGEILHIPEEEITNKRENNPRGVPGFNPDDLYKFPWETVEHNIIDLDFEL